MKKDFNVQKKSGEEAVMEDQSEKLNISDYTHVTK